MSALSESFAGDVVSNAVLANTQSANISSSTALALSPKQLKIVRDLLQQHLPDHLAWAFGSRTAGRARKYSDLDIAVSHAQPLTFHKLCRLGTAFEESDLDICVDIVDWAQTDSSFRSSVQHNAMVRLQ